MDHLLKQTRDRHGVAVAKLTRTVLSGISGLAGRHGPVRGNLVRDAPPIHSEWKVRSPLNFDELRDLRARLANDQRAIDQDLPDLGS